MVRGRRRHPNLALRRMGSACAALVVLTLSAGCGRSLSPRTSAQLDTHDWNQGALVDASRAYPVAFWADACTDPEGREVAGDKLVTGQWLAHLSASLNNTLAKAGLYDMRFAEIGAQVVGGKLAAGHFVYRCEPEARAVLRRNAARVVEVRLLSAEVVKVVSDRAVQVKVAVKVGQRTLYYQAHSIRASWDVEVFSTLGRAIIGDVKFWEAAATPF